MSDINTDGAMLKDLAGNIQHTKFQIGTLVAARLAVKAYGEDTAGELARVSGINKRSLYEYSAVAEFIHQIVTYDGWKGEADAFYATHPAIGHTHLRIALPGNNAKWGIEDALDALLAITNGDPERPDFNKSLPMSADMFALYVAAVKGRTPHTGGNGNKGAGLTGDIKDILNAADEPAMWTSCTVRADVSLKAQQLVNSFMVDNDWGGDERIEIIIRMLPPEAE